MTDIIDRLQPIFQDVFDNKTLRVGRDADANSVQGWDSLAHIRLITAIEQEFEIDFTLPELEMISNVGNLADLIASKRAPG